jgi:hypothetical protein
MANAEVNTDDEHTEEKIEYNKTEYKKEVEAIFKESINQVEQSFAYFSETKNYLQYRHTQMQIRLQASERLGVLIADDICDSMINGHPTQLLNPDLSVDLLKHIESKMKEMDRIYLGSWSKHFTRCKLS